MEAGNVSAAVRVLDKARALHFHSGFLIRAGVHQGRIDAEPVVTAGGGGGGSHTALSAQTALAVGLHSSALPRRELHLLVHSPELMVGHSTCRVVVSSVSELRALLVRRFPKDLSHAGCLLVVEVLAPEWSQYIVLDDAVLASLPSGYVPAFGCAGSVSAVSYRPISASTSASTA
jgi:hypothetical protein